MTPLEVLRGMRSRLAMGWTQHAMARDANGAPCEARDPGACTWCIYGAALATCPDSDARLAAYLVLRSQIGTNLPGWNDDNMRKKGEVLGLIENGIAELETAS